MRSEDLNNLRANQYFLVEELERRGIAVEVIDLEGELLEAIIGSHHELLLNIDSSLVSYPASVIAGEKPVAKTLLERASVSVPGGATFKAHMADEAAAFAEKLGFPVVVKPAFGTQGEHVYTHVEYASELKEIFGRIFREQGSVRVMVEEHFEGREYRIFITARGQYAVIWRDPAYVMGNGAHTVEELAGVENYARTHPRSNCLCPIVLDEAAADFLRKQGLSFSYVPAAGEKIYLRGNSNLKTGAMAEDVTDIAHPSAIDIALRALHAIPGLPYAGIDFMCRDISSPQTRDSYRVIEVNSLPGIGMHINPGRGKSRNVAAMIVDMMFPESAVVRKAA